MLGQLRQTLDRLSAEHEKQRAVVKKLDEPARKLAEIETALAAAQAERDRVDARLASLAIEIPECEQWLATYGTHEAKLPMVVEVLDLLADVAMRAQSNMSAYDIGRVAHQVRDTMEFIAVKRAEHARLLAERKQLQGV